MKSIAKRRYIWSLVTDKYRSLIIESLTLKSKQRIEPKASNLKPNVLASFEIRHLKTTKLIFEK